MTTTELQPKTSERNKVSEIIPKDKPSSIFTTTFQRTNRNTETQKKHNNTSEIF